MGTALTCTKVRFKHFVCFLSYLQKTLGEKQYINNKMWYTCKCDNYPLETANEKIIHLKLQKRKLSTRNQKTQKLKTTGERTVFKIE